MRELPRSERRDDRALHLPVLAWYRHPPLQIIRDISYKKRFADFAPPVGIVDEFFFGRRLTNRAHASSANSKSHKKTPPKRGSLTSKQAAKPLTSRPRFAASSTCRRQPCTA